MPLPEVAVSALLLQDRVSNENGPDSGFYYWLCIARTWIGNAIEIVFAILVTAT